MTLQGLLNARIDAKQQPLTIDDEFGPATESHVKQEQSQHKIPADGEIGRAHLVDLDPRRRRRLTSKPRGVRRLHHPRRAGRTAEVAPTSIAVSKSPADLIYIFGKGVTVERTTMMTIS